MGFTSAELPSGGQQRAYGTVVFCDMAGSTRLGEQLEPEDLAPIVLSVRRHLYAAFEAMGGLIVQFQGDGVHVLFGYPETDEDAPRRAILAALTAHEQVLNAAIAGLHGRPVSLHTGIHSGFFVIEEGLSTDGRYLLIGDAVNVASHLCNVARPGQILVSETTLGGISAFFQTSAVSPTDLQGKRRTVPAAQVLGRSDAGTRYAARTANGMAKLVGRADVLETLRAVREPPGITAACLIAEAGVGKSRLAAEFTAEAAEDGTHVASGVCEHLGGCPPLQPVRHLMQQLLGLPSSRSAGPEQGVTLGLERIAPSLAVHAPVVMQVLGTGPKSAAPLDLGAVSGALRAICEGLNTEAPVLLCIDDWQWADDASRQVVAGLLAMDSDARIMILLASRTNDPDDAATSLAKAVPLEALETDAAEALARALLHPETPEPLIAQIIARAGGNALYLEEVCDGVNALIAEGGAPSSLPDASASLHGAISARLERVDEAERALLGTAAVLGITVEIALLARVTGEQDQDTLSERLLATGLMLRDTVPGRLRFRHGIVQEQVYRAMALPTRRALHMAVAEALADPFETGARADPERLAHHFAAAGVPAEATGHAERAGDRAIAAASMDLARFQYAAALRSLDALEETARTRARFVSICERWAIPCVYGPEPDQIQTLSRAILYAKQAGDHGAVAGLNRWLGYIYYVLGLLPRSIHRFEEALKGAQAIGHKGLLAQVQANLGQAHGAAAEYEPALNHLDQAIDSTAEYQVQRRSNAVPVAGAYALACRALVHADKGAFAAAEADIDRALHEFGGAGHMIEGSIRNMAGPIHLWRACYDDAVSGAQRSREIAETAGAHHVLAFAFAIEGYARAKQGDFAPGMALLRRGIAMLERRRLHLYASFMYGWLAEAAMDAGALDEAGEQARRAILRAEEHDFFGEAMAHRVLARLAAEDGGAGARAVYHSLDQADRAAERRSAPHEIAATALLRATLLDKAGRPGDARIAAVDAAERYAALGLAKQAGAARQRLGGGADS